MVLRTPRRRLGGIVTNVTAKSLWKFYRLGAAVLFILCLAVAGHAQDGTTEGQFREGRIVWKFTVFCWPAEQFTALMWQRWRLHEFGWGVAVPPLILDSESQANGQIFPIARLWISEDQRTWAYSYVKPDGQECLIDVGADLTFSRPLKKFGQPISVER